MLEVVEKLLGKKEKLAAGFNKTKTVYRTEIKKIDAAVRKFTNAYTALQIILPEEKLSTPNMSRTAAIENILAENGPQTVKDTRAALAAFGYSMTIQSVSGILQINAKKGRRFKKVAPATFALLKAKSVKGSVDKGKNIKISRK